MFNLRLNDSEVARYQYEGMIYLPDVVLYNMDAETYKQFWHNLKALPTKRLYTDGIEVFQVSWLQSLFQSFKGWLNRIFGGLIEFDNHCGLHKVEMTLAKIAYYGYLRGFNQNELFPLDLPLISDAFRKLVCQPRENNNSSQLQAELINYYFNHQADFPTLYIPIRVNYSFGQAFLMENIPSLVPSIDPQNKSLINEVLNALLYKVLPANELDCLKLSLFSELYAQHLVSRDQLKIALDWSDQIDTRNKEIYIYFYWSSNNRTPYEDDKVFFTKKTVQLLAAFMKENPSKTIEIIKKEFSIDEQVNYFAEYPELKHKLAKTYLDEAQAEKNKSTVVKWLIGNKLFPILEKAVRLDPRILDKDESLKGITLKEEWIAYRFSEAIIGKRLIEARALYEAHPTFKLDNNNLNALREDYCKEFHLKKLEISKALAIPNLALAEKTALAIKELAIKIDRINPKNNLTLDATILHAETLFKIDTAEHPVVKNANLNRLKAAHNLLAPLLLPNKSEAVLQIMNAITTRKIDYYVEQLRVHCTKHIEDHWDARKDYADSNKAKIDQLKELINRYINLNKNNQKPEERHILGKMYYLLGDVILFSTANTKDAEPHFHLAHKTMPNNPYYHFRYLQMIGSDNKATERAKARKKIEDLAYRHGEHYDLYMDERWDQKRVQDTKVNIHPMPEEESGILSSLLKMF